jgi:glycine reductase
MTERRTRRVGVHQVKPGSETSLRDGVLTIVLAEIEKLVLGDVRIDRCEARIVHPGQEVRLVHVLDSFRPVCSVEGPGHGAFTGITSPQSSLDRSDSVELDGLVVTMVGHIPSVDSFLTQQEGILDMAGPGAGFSPLSQVSHLVLSLGGAEGQTSDEVSDSFRQASMRVAEHLASIAVVSEEEGEYVTDPSDEPGSGRLVHICEVSAFGKMFDTLVSGTSVMGMLPVLVSASALRSGAVVSADYHYAGQRNYTCFYQRNPVADAIRASSREATLVGTILLPVGGDHTAKERGAAFAAHLASSLGAQGAVITAVAGGNAHLDVMFAVRECESRGIRSALSLVEMAGPSGADPGMVDTVPEADLIISTGNREALVSLPAANEVIGGRNLFEGPAEESGGAAAEGRLVVPLRAIVGVNNEMGAWTVEAQVS